MIGQITQGDEYGLPFYIELNDEVITPDDVDNVRISVGGIEKSYKTEGNYASAGTLTGDIVFQSDDNVWCYMVSESDSMSLTRKRLDCHIQVKMANDNGIYSSDIGYIKLEETDFLTNIADPAKKEST